eukprot:1162062-Pelagomonas_calceolata.AAC.20
MLVVVCSLPAVLAALQKNLHMELKESWYEKLCRWDEALAAYESRWGVLNSVRMRACMCVCLCVRVRALAGQMGGDIRCLML